MGTYNGITYADESFIVGCFDSLLGWQKAGLSYTASGYGAKIPTGRMVKCSDGRTRRVYCITYSNSGSLYIIIGRKRVYVSHHPLVNV